MVGVAVLAVAGRRLGASEQASAASLAIGATAVLVVHAAQQVDRGGLHWLATVLVSSDLPESRNANLGFTLAIGAERLEGSLEHGVRRWKVGRRVRRYHVQRSSVYLETRIAPGVRELSLARLSSPSPSPLRIDVHRRVIPSWALLLLSSAALVLAGGVEVRTRTRGRIAPAAGAALAAGLFAGWSATPDHALWPVIGSLAVGAFVGGAAGLATSAAARWLRVAATRAVSKS